MRLPAQLLHRRLNSHKGDYGKVLILAGSLGLSGAAILSAKACLRTGAGMVFLGIPESLNHIFETSIIEAITIPLKETKMATLSVEAFSQIEKISKKIDILVIGPGLSQHPSTKRLVLKIMRYLSCPCVVDADGINALKGRLNLLKKISKRGLILTPHLGEFSRLINEDIKRIQTSKKEVAKKFAEDYNLVLVLKGYKTVVSSPKQTYINTTGNPGMATAGSGDVLTGMIASFWAQGLDSFYAAKYAVYLHGLAGDLAAKKISQLALTASDIIKYIPQAIKNSI